MSKNKLSRRNFILGSLGAAFGVGVSFSGPPIFARGPFHIDGTSSSRGKFKLGIIGCGNRSKTHISVLNRVEDIEVAALCDLIPHKMNRRMQLIRNGREPKLYKDMEKMLRQDDLDAVAILLPNHLHKQGTIAALEAGKHVFCEKPMALTVADCNEMIATAQRTRKALQIGTQRRHSRDYKMLVETIRNSPVGKVLHSDINSYRGDWRVLGLDEYPPGIEYWRMDQSKCGGVVYEMGAHIIDANNWIFDSEPMSVSSIQGVNNLSLRKRDSMDHAGVHVRYANDAFMNYGGNLYNYGPAPHNYFYAVNGTIAFDGREVSIYYGHPRGFSRPDKLPKPLKKSFPEGDGNIQQWRYFAQVMEGKKQAYPDGYIGRQTIQICEGSVIAAQENREIAVSELG